MSEGSDSNYNNIEQPHEQSSQQEALRVEIDKVLDEYFLLLSRRGLDNDGGKLYKDIQEKRELLIQLVQRLNGQLGLDNAFSEKIETQLELAEKGIEIGHDKLAGRKDGKDNIEAMIADTNVYSEELNRVDRALDSIQSILEDRNPEREEIENLIFELKTMVKAFMKMGANIQKLILSLEAENKEEFVQRQLRIINNAVQSIKHFNENSSDKKELNRIKISFYENFDEALHLYEELRDLTK